MPIENDMKENCSVVGRRRIAAPSMLNRNFRLGTVADLRGSAAV